MPPRRPAPAIPSDRTSGPGINRTWIGLAAVVSALCTAAPAAADQGFALPRFQPSFAGDKLFGVQSAYGGGESTPFAMLLFDYAHDPLVLRDTATGKTYGAIVKDQMLLHLDASYALWKAVTFNVDLPFAAQHGEEPHGGDLPAFGAPTSTAVADLRLGVRATLFGGPEDPFQLALGGVVWLPTGSRAAFTSDGRVRGQPLLIAGGAARWFVWSASVGPELRAKVPFVTETPGPALRWGAGMGFLLADGSFQLGPELTGAVALDPTQRSDVDLEGMLGARLRFARAFTTGFALALGLSPGVHTPDFRSVLSVAYTPLAAPTDHHAIPAHEDACPDIAGARVSQPQGRDCAPLPDRDGDGVPDREDACPDVPGVRDSTSSINGCPTDRDNDGIPDREDACPDLMGPRSPDPKKNGCPVAGDRDGDGIADERDACPDDKGAANPDSKKNGCPIVADRDHDGIPDARDACPDDKGPADPDPQKNGCPRDVRVTEDQIVLLQQVEFDGNRATIHAVSRGLLDTVAQVLREHREIVRVEVQGHTDNRGSTEVNTRLSQKRAEAVVAALVQRGIDGRRLVAKGYGPARPIMANLTTMGRQKNRRVELHILERRAKAP